MNRTFLVVTLLFTIVAAAENSPSDATKAEIGKIVQEGADLLAKLRENRTLRNNLANSSTCAPASLYLAACKKADDGYVAAQKTYEDKLKKISPASLASPGESGKGGEMSYDQMVARMITIRDETKINREYANSRNMSRQCVNVVISKENKCSSSTPGCITKNSCIDDVLGSWAEAKNLAKEEELILNAAVRAKDPKIVEQNKNLGLRDANSLAELFEDDVTLPKDCSLRLDHYIDSEKIAFTTTKDGCTFTVTPINSLAEYKPYAFGEVATGWKVAKDFVPSNGPSYKVKQPDVCTFLNLEYPFRDSCLQKTRNGGSGFIYPASIELAGPNGKKMTVYSHGDDWGLFKCIKDYGFVLPKYPANQLAPLIPATGVEMSSAGSGN